MADSNTNRANAKARFQKNKAAFEEVFGNPFVKPEPLQGHYQRFTAATVSIKAVRYDEDPHGTKNPCSPSAIDFVCDVDKLVMRCMTQPGDLGKFLRTYITDDDPNAFTPKQRQRIEQEIGTALLEHKLSPVLGYFRTERKPGMMTRK